MLPVVWNKQDILKLLQTAEIEVLLVDSDYLVENNVTVQELETSSFSSKVKVIILPKNVTELNIVTSGLNSADFEAPKEVDATEGCLVIFTSGSTAQPKGVVHYNLVGLMFMGCLPWLRWIMSDYGTSISYTPNSYIGGLAQLFEALSIPEDRVILRKYDKKKYCEAIQKYRIQTLTLTPFFF